MSAAQRRRSFVAEMGLGPVWIRRDAAGDRAAPDEVTDAQQAAAAPAAQMSSSTAPPAMPEPSENLATFPDAEIAEMDWSALAASVRTCAKCGLCHGRTQAVLGVGDQKAKWLFVGEGPGREEDLQGEPFVGAAGKLFDNMLLSMGLRRGENAYIANIVKCRSTAAGGANRAPTRNEAAACLPYLERQISLVQPSIIVALGETAAVSLLGLDEDAAVAKLRGEIHRYRELPLIVTYHPAYLLRQPADKGKAWSDLCLAMSTYAERVS